MESLLCLSCFRSRQWLNPFWTLLKFFTLLLIVYELWNNNKYLPPNAPEWPWWWQQWQPQEWWPPLPQSHPRHRRISGNHFDNDEPNKVLSLSHLILLLLLDLIIHLLLCSLTVHDSTLQHRIILNHNFIWNKFKIYTMTSWEDITLTHTTATTLFSTTSGLLWLSARPAYQPTTPLL